MKRLASTFILLGLTGAISKGGPATQNPSATSAQASTAAEPPAKSAILPKGTRLMGKLMTKLDTRLAKAGDAVIVEVTKDVKSGDQVLLKKGSQIKGTLSKVESYSKGHSNADLEIVLDSVVPKNGTPVPNHFAIFALSAKVEEQPGDIYATKGKQGLANSASVSGQAGGLQALDLTPQSTGIYGYEGVELHPLVSMTPPTATINSNSGNIVLDKETTLVLESVGQ